MSRRGKVPGGFSLIEVATAVAIVAVALVVILGLLSGLAQRAGETQDRQVAVGLPDAIGGEVQRWAAIRGWDALLAETRATGEENGGLRWLAAKDGTGLREWAESESPVRDGYFLIEVRRVTEGALVVGANSPVLPLAVTVSWPYRPGSAAGIAGEVPRAERHRMQFNMAVNR